MGMEIINVFMASVLGQIDAGYALIMPEVLFVLRALLVITILFWGIKVAYSEEPFFSSLLLKMLYVGFFVYLIQNWPTLTEIVGKSFAMLGITAGGSAISLTDFMNPGAVVDIGYQLFKGLLQKSIDLTSLWGFLNNVPEVVVFLLTGLGVLVCFLIMGVQIFMAVITFKIVTLAAFILVPFGLWRGTGFLAERAIGYVFSGGIRLMVLAIIVSMGSSLFTSITLSADPTIQEAIAAFLASLVFVVLAFYGPALASDLVTGGPSLAGGAAFATAASAAAGMSVAARTFATAATRMTTTLQGVSTQQTVQRVAQAAGAGLGGPGGLRPSPTGGSAGGSPLAGPPTGGAPASAGASLRAGSSASQAGTSGPGPVRPKLDISRFLAQPATRTMSPMGAGPALSSGGGTQAMHVLRSTRDGDGGGGMQASVKDPGDET